MATIRAYLGVDSLTDVGYQFYSTTLPLGSRVTAGVTSEGDGWYSATGVTLAGDNLRWNSTGTPDAKAREDITLKNSIASIQAKTVNLPASPAATGDQMDLVSAPNETALTALAASVWSFGSRTLSSFGSLVSDVWAAASRTLTAFGFTVSAGGAVPTGTSITIVPDSPIDTSLCRVFGYFETIDNEPAKDVPITFELIANGIIRSERLIAGRSITVTTNETGRLVNFLGRPWVDLQRNDELMPTGSFYRITSGPLGINQEVTLAQDSFDLASLIS